MKTKATPHYRPDPTLACCNSNPTSEKGHACLLGKMQNMMGTPSNGGVSKPMAGNRGPNPLVKPVK